MLILVPIVGRGAIKLEQACSKFAINFIDKLVLDIGSSTGGFSDFALKNGASKVIAIELGTNQMDKVLRLDGRIELHEKTGHIRC
ncbi:MAG: SAM-dependent methyltransferase [Candidatus Saccharibacteria bacterium]